MNLTSDLIETLSRNFARTFLRSMPSHTHLEEDLRQEAAITIVACAARFNDANPNFRAYAYLYARKAMQKLCSEQAGPVRKSWGDGRDFSGTKHAYRQSYARGAVADADGTPSLPPTIEGLLGMTEGGPARPDELFERKQASEIVHAFVSRRAQVFSGKGKLTRATIRKALTDMMAGDTCLEVAKRYGCSKQRMHMLAAQAGI